MPPDAPNPAGSEHEHLFQPADVEYGRRMRRELFARRPLVRPCEICGARIDLTTGRRPIDLDMSR